MVVTMTKDCSGACVPESYVGDGVCDTGQRSAMLNCEALNFDRGDCKSSSATSVADATVVELGSSHKLAGGVALILLCFCTRTYFRRKAQRSAKSPSGKNVKYEQIQQADEYSAGPTDYSGYTGYSSGNSGEAYR